MRPSKTDALGLSMLVETINNRKSAGRNGINGSWPLPCLKRPSYPNGANICLDGKGQPHYVSGRVLDMKSNPIPGATLDVWQANEVGFYDVQQKCILPNNNLRGVFTSDSEGRYWFRSAYPRYYPILDDGTVGKMLKALDREPNRPAPHI